MVMATTGSVSSTSGWMAMAAPVSHAARFGRPRASARTAYRNSPTAIASSGWPQRTDTLHSATASAVASTARWYQGVPRCSAIASAANSTTADRMTWYGPASSHTAGCGLCVLCTASESPAASATATSGTRMTTAPGSDTRPVGWVYRPPRCRCSSRSAATSVPHRSSGSAQAVLPAMAGPHQIVESIPMTSRAAVASSGGRRRASRCRDGPGPAPAVPAPSTASLRTTVTAAKLAHRDWPGHHGSGTRRAGPAAERGGAAVATRTVTSARMNQWAILAGYGLLAGGTQLLWLSYAPITTQAHRVTGVSVGAAGDLAGIFPFRYVVLALPSDPDGGSRCADRRPGTARSGADPISARSGA